MRGFDLFLIEALRREMPVIARDIPVFQEFAGNCGGYLTDSNQPSVIAEAVRQMLGPSDKSTSASAAKYATCSKGANFLLFRLVGKDDHHRHWVLDGALRLSGHDMRMLSQAGVPHRHKMLSNGTSGLLTDGPYCAIKAGRYRLLT
ncbi:MAG: hypothetical protein V4512_16230 [Pseudomonadota bacterium]